VVYRSRYVGDTPLADAEQIRSRSVRYNRSAGITGLLWCGGSTFLQVIEGPTAAVDALFERIAGDRRHDAVSVLFDAAVDERLFENWFVALAAFDDPVDVLDALSPLLTTAESQDLVATITATVHEATIKPG
jgi:hypothetical protein